MIDVSDRQLLIMLAFSLLFGAALGVFWIVFSFCRFVLTPNSDGHLPRVMRAVITFVTDFMFFVFAGICTAVFFFAANNGNIRIIGILGMTAGFAAEHFLLGRRTITALAGCISFVRRVLVFIYRHSIGWLFSRIMAVPLRTLKARRAARQCRRKQKRKRADSENYSI